jgi:hypothetical protein
MAAHFPYTADDSGSVLFGWAELGPEDEIAVGPNKGAFKLDEKVRVPGDPIDLIGFDLVLGVVPLAFECTMGVPSRGDDGVGTALPLSSRSPDAALIACPIEAPSE